MFQDDKNMRLSEQSSQTVTKHSQPSYRSKRSIKRSSDIISSIILQFLNARQIPWFIRNSLYFQNNNDHIRQKIKTVISSTVSILMVELTGFEPVTSSMPWRRASSCAKTPVLLIYYNTINYFETIDLCFLYNGFVMNFKNLSKEKQIKLITGLCACRLLAIIYRGGI